MTTDFDISASDFSLSTDVAEPMLQAPPSAHLLEQARTAKREKKPLAYRTACEAWLLRDRGIHVGDTVKLHYSGELREILLETFELHWPSGQDTELPTLVFEGPTVQQKPRRIERASNWCSRTTRVSKELKQSPFMRSRLMELAAA